MLHAFERNVILFRFVNNKNISQINKFKCIDQFIVIVMKSINSNT